MFISPIDSRAEWNIIYLFSRVKILDLSLSLSFSFVMFRYLSNGVYILRNNYSLEQYQVYCHMTEIARCGSGGWTLVMKIDGNKVKIILD